MNCASALLPPSPPTGSTLRESKQASPLPREVRRIGPTGSCLLQTLFILVDLAEINGSPTCRGAQCCSLRYFGGQIDDSNEDENQLSNDAALLRDPEPPHQFCPLPPAVLSLAPTVPSPPLERVGAVDILASAREYECMSGLKG
mmetsp:Transcript_4535/g.13686  ORF Transcript_4535/g.13686 Transcript_4535/m.13686 type:complete len:144 (-) Transcript_4535:36-467(-)